MIKHRIKCYLFTSILIFMNTLCHALTDDNTYYDHAIENIQKQMQKQNFKTIADKIDWISSNWLGKPYLLYALGEGPESAHDRRPLYRTDAFDCETFVDTTLALANAHDLKSFKKNINLIRYHHGNASFIERNHFTSMDWNQHNQEQGFIKDFTPQMPITKKSITSIDKASWYQHLNIKRLYLPGYSRTKKKARLEILKAQGQRFKPVTVTIDYVPLNQLFDNKGHPDIKQFDKIPHGAIIEIVRPNWNLRQAIGTSLDISHLGFAIRKQGVLWFRNASIIHHQVIDEPLIGYLKKYLSSPTIKGIHIEIPQKCER